MRAVLRRSRPTNARIRCGKRRLLGCEGEFFGTWAQFACLIQARSLIPCHAGIGGGRGHGSPIRLKTRSQQCSWHRDFGRLEHDVLSMPRDPAAALYKLVVQDREPPVLHMSNTTSDANYVPQIRGQIAAEAAQASWRTRRNL